MYIIGGLAAIDTSTGTGTDTGATEHTEQQHSNYKPLHLLRFDLSNNLSNLWLKPIVSPLANTRLHCSVVYNNSIHTLR
jgi:hypothetical protein